MATSRYSRTENQQLADRDYKEVYPEKFDDRRKFFINKIATLNIRYPTFDDILAIDYEDYVWSLGDRYYKLAQTYYGDTRYWWVIAWFNKKPTESHLKVGDIVRIPKSIDTLLSTMGYW